MFFWESAISISRGDELISLARSSFLVNPTQPDVIVISTGLSRTALSPVLHLDLWAWLCGWLRLSNSSRPYSLSPQLGREEADRVWTCERIALNW